MKKKSEAKKGEAKIEGRKDDGGKPMPHLIPPRAMLEVAKVMSYGAAKYAPHNWSKGVLGSRYASAGLRHVYAWLAGHERDDESGLPHLAHAGACLLMLLELTMSRPDLDDRDPRLVARALWAKGVPRATEKVHKKRRG